jgi:hypothetical protein
MKTAAAMRLTKLHGDPKSTLVGPAHARDGTEVLVLPWPDQTPPSGCSHRRRNPRSIGGLPSAPGISRCRRKADAATLPCMPDKLPVEVLTELGRVTWAVVRLEDYVQLPSRLLTRTPQLSHRSHARDLDWRSRTRSQARQIQVGGG